MSVFKIIPAAIYYKKKQNSVIVFSTQVVNMQGNDILSVVLLCIINIIFMVAGIFLNSVVIISLWRSSQLRKKPCYFMILVLSCFDLAAVAINHPFLIVSTIYLSQGQGEIHEIVERTRKSVSFVVCGSSMFALFTLNVERLLALTRPFFHQASVTKTRLLCLQAFWTVIMLGLSVLLFFIHSQKITDICASVLVLSLLFLFIYSNYKVFKFAKSKREDERGVSIIAKLMDENRKTRILNLKNISTCSLAVGCFFFCSCPLIIYSTVYLASETLLSEMQYSLFELWSCTFVFLNSTFNCVIFFWRNSILRREGMKIVNAFLLHVTN